MPENEEHVCALGMVDPVYISEMDEPACASEVDDRACLPETDGRACAPRKRMSLLVHWGRMSLLARRKQMSLLARRRRINTLAHMRSKDAIPEMDEHAVVSEKDEPVCASETDERACALEAEELACTPETEECTCVPEAEAVTRACKGGIDAYFLRHMSQYIGATVTIYTAGGGKSGCGMTGVLIECGGSYVRLLIKPASAPERAQRFCRACPFYPVCRARMAARKPQGGSAGVMADISVAHITTFVHSAVCGEKLL